MIIILFIKLLITKGHMNNKINSEISTNNSKRLQKHPDIVYMKISHWKNFEPRNDYLWKSPDSLLRDLWDYFEQWTSEHYL